MTGNPNITVAVIGAGPVGLFAALLLAQSGIQVNVYEAEEIINQSPRAVAYFPAVLEEFSKAGILKDVIDAGEEGKDGCAWRDAYGNVLCALDPPPNSPHTSVCLSQPEVCEIFYRRLIETGNANVHFNHMFRRLEQGEGTVKYWVRDIRSDADEVEQECKYLIGADGGRSTVRQSLGLELQGHTWDNMQFVAVNFRYPLSELGWKHANFIVDPVDWAIIVKRGKGTAWRMATGVGTTNPEKATVLNEAIKQTVKDRLSRLLPGDTSMIQYEAMAPYVTHQRCAPRFKQGNVILAGDAAHLNNPVGGLGLTTGILDAAHLAKALQQVLVEGNGQDVLTKYAEVRREIFLNVTDPMSTANLLRLHSEDPVVVKQRRDFFAELNDPREFVGKLRVGLPDSAISSTAEKLFDTYHEVTWFISVTKIEGWTEEKFQYEYKDVHANMARKGREHGGVVRRYVQIPNSDHTMEGSIRPHWDFVTCLTFPSVFLIHAGFQDPAYRATAGAHIFCRLDQQGCLARQVARYSKGSTENNSDIGAVRALVYHNRVSETDDFSGQWFKDRSTTFTKLAASDSRLHTYILWRDVTPKNADYLFQDSQFSGGSWLAFKAVEAFDFKDENAAKTFLGEHNRKITGHLGEGPIVVIGEPDIIF